MLVFGACEYYYSHNGTYEVLNWTYLSELQLVWSYSEVNFVDLLWVFIRLD